MALVIRRVVPSDLPAVQAALIECWHATYDTIYGPAKVVDITSRWHGLDTLASQAVDPASAFLLAEQGDILGSSLARRFEDGTVHLYRLYVRPAAQGLGIGHALMAATFATMPHATRHRLEVSPQNTGAIAFYRRAGFRGVARTSDCGGSSGEPALILERTL